MNQELLLENLRNTLDPVKHLEAERYLVSCAQHTSFLSHLLDSLYSDKLNESEKLSTIIILKNNIHKSVSKMQPGDILQIFERINQLFFFPNLPKNIQNNILEALNKLINATNMKSIENYGQLILNIIKHAMESKPTSLQESFHYFVRINKSFSLFLVFLKNSVLVNTKSFSHNRSYLLEIFKLVLQFVAVESQSYFTYFDNSVIEHAPSFLNHINSKPTEKSYLLSFLELIETANSILKYMLKTSLYRKDGNLIKQCNKMMLSTSDLNVACLTFNKYDFKTKSLSKEATSESICHWLLDEYTKNNLQRLYNTGLLTIYAQRLVYLNQTEVVQAVSKFADSNNRLIQVGWKLVTQQIKNYQNSNVEEQLQAFYSRYSPEKDLELLKRGLSMNIHLVHLYEEKITKSFCVSENPTATIAYFSTEEHKLECSLEQCMHSDNFFLILIRQLKVAAEISALYKFFFKDPAAYNFIVFQLLFRLIVFSNQETNLFDDDPSEFVLKIENSLNDKDDVRKNAFEFLAFFFKIRTDLVLSSIYEYLAHFDQIIIKLNMQTKQSQPLNINRTDFQQIIFGIEILEAIYSYSSNNNAKQNFDSLVEKYILPLLSMNAGSSSSSFTKTSLDIVHYLIMNFFYNEDNVLEEEVRKTKLIPLLQQFACNDNTHKVIKREALFAIMEIAKKLKDPQSALEGMDIGSLVKSMISLIDDFSANFVILSLIGKFLVYAKEKLTPYAANVAKFLCQKGTDLFWLDKEALQEKALDHYQLTSHKEESGDEEEYSTSSALLNSLNSLLYAVKESPDFILELEKEIMPFLIKLLGAISSSKVKGDLIFLSSTGFEFDEEHITNVASIIDNFVYAYQVKGIPLTDSWWYVFPAVCQLILLTGNLSLDELSTIMESFLNCPSGRIYAPDNLKIFLFFLDAILREEVEMAIDYTFFNLGPMNEPLSSQLMQAITVMAETSPSDLELESIKHFLQLTSTFLINSKVQNNIQQLLSMNAYQKLADFTLNLLSILDKLLAVPSNSEDVPAHFVIKNESIEQTKLYVMDTIASFLFADFSLFFNYLGARGIAVKAVFEMFCLSSFIVVDKPENVRQNYYFVRKFVFCLGSLFLDQKAIDILSAEFVGELKKLALITGNVLKILVRKVDFDNSKEGIDYNNKYDSYIDYLQELEDFDEDDMEIDKDQMQIVNLNEEEDFKPVTTKEGVPIDQNEMVENAMENMGQIFDSLQMKNLLSGVNEAMFFQKGLVALQQNWNELANLLVKEIVTEEELIKFTRMQENK